MAALPVQNFYATDKSFWMQNTNDLVISTITLQDSVVINGVNGQNVELAALNSTATLSLVVPNSNGFLSGAIIGAADDTTTYNAITIAAAGGDQNAYIYHTYYGSTIGAIGFVSSIYGEVGGVTLTSGDNTQFNVVKDGTNVTDGSSGQVITTVFNSATTALIQYKPDGAINPPVASIEFAKATSTIQLSVGSNAIGVSATGAFTSPASCQKTLAPVSPSVVIASNAAETPLISYSNLQPNTFYRVGFTASFQNTTNNPANSNDYIQLYAYGQGSPNDGEDIATINNSWMVTSSNTPGLLGGANGFYGCTFAPLTSNWVVYAAPSPNQQNNVQINMDFVYLEKML